MQFVGCFAAIAGIYAMLVQNAAALDANNVHHLDARNREFKWQEVCENVKLLLKAPQDYWNFYAADNLGVKSKGQNGAAFRTIIEECREMGLIIETE